MNIIVHIGTEKTGTTTIQEMLHQNRENLIKSGFYFLKTPGPYNNRELPAYCIRDDRPDEYFRDKAINSVEEKAAFRQEFLRRFLNEIDSLPSTVNTVIASSEHFHSRLNYIDEIQILKDLLSKRFKNIKIFTYIRKQVDAAISSYSTFLISGGSSGPLDFISAHCRPDNDYFNYFNYLKKWEEVFGKNNLVVRLFDKTDFVNKNLLDDFLTQIDPNILGSIDTNIQNKNESINQFGQCLINSINKHIPRFSEDVVSRTKNYELTKIVMNGATGSGVYLDEKNYKEIQSRFRDINEAVRREYFPDRAFIFDESTTKSGGMILTKENEAVLDKIIGILANTGASDFYDAVLKDLAEMRANRDTIHDQLVSVLNDHALLQKEFTRANHELQYLKTKLTNRLLLKLRSMLRSR